MTFLATFRPTAPGECIYCQKENDYLTEEHPLPFGLGGTIKLAKASCEDCRLTTQQFETKALRGGLGPGRYWLGLPERKKNKRPLAWPAFKAQDGSRIMIPLEDLPFYLCMPTYRTMRQISGAIPKEHTLVTDDSVLVISEDNATFANKLAKYGADSVVPDLDHLAFARMMAKIALGYCEDNFGRGGFTPTLGPLILGESRAYSHVVSSSLRPLIGDADMVPLERRFEHRFYHVVQPTTGQICVKLDLFENLNAPSYYVLAGYVGQHIIRAGWDEPD